MSDTKERPTRKHHRRDPDYRSKRAEAAMKSLMDSDIIGKYPDDDYTFNLRARGAAIDMNSLFSQLVALNKSTRAYGGDKPRQHITEVRNYPFEGTVTRTESFRSNNMYATKGEFYPQKKIVSLQLKKAKHESEEPPKIRKTVREPGYSESDPPKLAKVRTDEKAWALNEYEKGQKKMQEHYGEKYTKMKRTAESRQEEYEQLRRRKLDPKWREFEDREYDSDTQSQ